MNTIRNFYNRIISPKLCKEVERSQALMKRYAEENVFKSNTLNEMLSDRFDYKGCKPDTIYVKDLETGNPFEVTVKIIRHKLENITGFVQEKYLILDEMGREIGRKDFHVVKENNGKYTMLAGEMDNFSEKYGGVGLRLDQMQIERALELGITSIPRDALAQATLYHTKMGFLPIENKLVRVDSQRIIPKFTETEFRNRLPDEAMNSFEPVIVEKNGKFYIDVNKTQANANLKACKEIIEKTKAYRISGIQGSETFLTLSGEELEHWREILKGHEILPKLECAR